MWAFSPTESHRAPSSWHGRGDNWVFLIDALDGPTADEAGLLLQTTQSPLLHECACIAAISSSVATSSGKMKGSIRQSITYKPRCEYSGHLKTGRQGAAPFSQFGHDLFVEPDVHLR